MNNVGTSASGVRSASRMARCASGQIFSHQLTSLHVAGRSLAGAPGGVEEDLVEGRVLRQTSAIAELRLQRVGCAFPNDDAIVDDRQPVAQLIGFFEVLRREEDGGALLVDAPHLLPHRQAARRVETGRRFVEEQHLGPVHQRRGEVEPPLHATRVALDPAVGGIDQLDELEQLLRAVDRLLRASYRTGGPAARAARGRSDAGRARPPAAPRRCAAGPRRVRRRRRRPPPRAEPEVMVMQRRQHPDGRRLAGTVRPEEAEDLTGCDRRGRPRGRPRPYRHGRSSA